MANTETKWFVEPRGRYAAHTNEIIAQQLGNEYAWRTSRVLANGHSNPYIRKANLWPVPSYAFITALYGMQHTSFLVFTQEGNGQIREHDKKLFDKKARAHRTRSAVRKAG